ncbi:MAG: TRAP transporter small permease, partial [Clostridiales Family XIII bacterium]|nr:TRAP transporter small permease [Clostridiales Family XIII bacterium]
MKVLRLINDRLEEIFLVVLMAFATGLVAAQVLTRHLGIPLSWSEELARFCFLWLIWVGAAYATKKRKHIAIDIVINRLPKVGRNVLSIIVSTIIFAFLIFMVIESTIVLEGVISNKAIGIGTHLPMSVPYASVTVGVVLML